MCADLYAQYDIRVCPPPAGILGKAAFDVEPFVKGDEYPGVWSGDFFCTVIQYLCFADGAVPCVVRLLTVAAVVHVRGERDYSKLQERMAVEERNDCSDYYAVHVLPGCIKCGILLL